MSRDTDRNARIIRSYLVWLKEARGLADASVDRAAGSIARFEAYSGGADFATFNAERARAFKRHLDAARAARGKGRLSASTVDGTLRDLRAFFRWLADQAGYRSKISHSDADHFTPPKRTARAARGGGWRDHPSMEQALHAFHAMPAGTEVERRDRAIFAALLLTGSRDGALVTLRMANLDVRGRCVRFEGREVETKFGKRFTTWFFPVGHEVEAALVGWHDWLRSERLFGPGDPLFPREKVGRGPRGFEAQGLDRAPWSSGAPVARICSGAFARVGLTPFTPHLLRKTLVDLAYERNLGPEAMKAWSQNLGHEDVMTTFRSYGAVSPGRQRDLLLGHAAPREAVTDVFDDG